MLSYLITYLLICSLTYLLALLLNYLLAYVLYFTYLLAYLPTYLPTYLPAYSLTYLLLTCLPGYRVEGSRSVVPVVTYLLTAYQATGSKAVAQLYQAMNDPMDRLQCLRELITAEV